MNFTLRQLRYFKALSEHRNFGRAAAAMHVTQPALSVQIRELEGHLGAALVERRSRDVALTAFGRQMLDFTVRILAASGDMAEAARWRGGLSGLLRLGIIPTIAPYLLPAALAGLRARDLSLDVQVQEGKTDRLLAELRAGELDVALLALPVAGSDLVAEPLFADRFVLAGSKGRLARTAPEDLRPEDLRPGELLLLEDGHCLTDQALDVCGQARGDARINMGASSLGTLSQLVAAGFGLTLMPELAIPSERRTAPDLVLRRFAAPEPAREIGLVRRRSSLDDGWFRDLAALLSEIGAGIVAGTRAAP